MKFLVVSEGWEYFNTFTNKWGFGNSYLVITSLVKLSVCVCVCVCVCLCLCWGKTYIVCLQRLEVKDLNRKISDCIIMFTLLCDLEYCLERIGTKLY